MSCSVRRGRLRSDTHGKIEHLEFCVLDSKGSVGMICLIQSVIALMYICGRLDFIGCEYLDIKDVEHPFYPCKTTRFYLGSDTEKRKTLRHAKVYILDVCNDGYNDELSFPG